MLHDYFNWATTTTTTMARYHHSADGVPDGLTIPRWSWEGLVDGTDLERTRGSRLGTRRARMAAMGRATVDLFDDPPWPAGGPAARRARTSRPLLGAALALVVALLASMGLGWFGSGEMHPVSPLSHWLALGSGPGTQKWGFLVVGVGVALVVALALGGALRWPRPVWGVPLMALATALLAVVALDTTAHPSVDPGPALGADYGAWIGDALATSAWLTLAVATIFSVADRHEERRQSH